MSLRRTVHAAALPMILVTLESAHCLSKAANQLRLKPHTLSVEARSDACAAQTSLLDFLYDLGAFEFVASRASQELPRAILAYTLWTYEIRHTRYLEFLSALFAAVRVCFRVPADQRHEHDGDEGKPEDCSYNTVDSKEKNCARYN